MGTVPDALEIVAAHVTLLVHGPVELGSVVSLGMQFHSRGGPGLILVGRSGDFLARAASNDP